MAKVTIAHYRVTESRKFRLKDSCPDHIDGSLSKEQSTAALQSGLARLNELQEKLMPMTAGRCC